MTKQKLLYDFNPLNLPPEIDWIPMSLASNLLGIHPSQVRRDRAVLLLLDLIAYTPRSKGFDRKSFESLWIFRQLVEERGRAIAIAQINQILEESNGRER